MYMQLDLGCVAAQAARNASTSCWEDENARLLRSFDSDSARVDHFHAFFADSLRALEAWTRLEVNHGGVGGGRTRLATEGRCSRQRGKKG
jgi:hypothetical protein